MIETQLLHRLDLMHKDCINNFNREPRHDAIQYNRILIGAGSRHSRRFIATVLLQSLLDCHQNGKKIKDTDLKKESLQRSMEQYLLRNCQILKRDWLMDWFTQKNHWLRMAQLDGSLQRLVLLDAFLKTQVGELRGRGEEGRRGEGRSTWDPACKVFIGGLKSSMGRLQLKVTNWISQQLTRYSRFLC